ncbi:MAG: hypothetical protein V4754_17080 [Pseudomonadota bacterium]
MPSSSSFSATSFAKFAYQTADGLNRELKTVRAQEKAKDSSSTSRFDKYSAAYDNGKAVAERSRIVSKGTAAFTAAQSRRR